MNRLYKRLPKIKMFFISGFLMFSLSSVALIPEAVIKIYVEYNDGTLGYGTGFFVSDNGEIITCYHIVNNSRKIRIFYKGIQYSNILILSIAPNFDLAKIKINSPNLNSQFISVNPDAKITTKIKAIGYPLNIEKLTHYGQVSKLDYVLSTKINGLNQKSVFNLEIDVIPLDLTIFNGMSGSPIISNGEMIGVLSGSIEQGGSIAWAIPVKYFENLSKLYDNPQNPNLIKWLPFELMQNDWRSMVKVKKVNEELLKRIDDYNNNNQKLIHSFDFVANNFGYLKYECTNLIKLIASNEDISSFSLDDLLIYLENLSRLSNSLQPLSTSLLEELSDFKLLREENLNMAIDLLLEFEENEMIDIENDTIVKEIEIHFSEVNNWANSLISREYLNYQIEFMKAYQIFINSKQRKKDLLKLIDSTNINLNKAMKATIKIINEFQSYEMKERIIKPSNMFYELFQQKVDE